MKSKKRAQSLIEYALILALVTVVAIAALQLLGKKINSAATNAGKNLDNATQNASNAYCDSIGGTYDESTGVCDPGNESSSGGG